MKKKIISITFLPVVLFLFLYSSCDSGDYVPPVPVPSGLELLSTKFVVLSKPDPYMTGLESEVLKRGNTVPVHIPYKNAQLGEFYQAYRKTLQIYGRDGNLVQIQLSYPSGTADGVEGFIEASLVAISSDYMPSDLEYRPTLNPLGKFELGNGACVELCSYVGVRDRFFGQGRDYIYGVLKGKDGRIWLNNNLGADYANTRRALFDPAQQAKSGGDYHAYGGLFQKYRSAEDGHADTKWLDANSFSVPGFMDVGTRSKTFYTNHNKIYPVKEDTWEDDWTTPGLEVDPNLWAVNGANNPCPEGFRIPRVDEFIKLYDSTHETVEDADLFDKLGLRMPNAPTLGGKEKKRSDSRLFYHTYDQSSKAIALRPGLGVDDYEWGTVVAIPIRCIRE